MPEPLDATVVPVATPVPSNRPDAAAFRAETLWSAVNLHPRTTLATLVVFYLVVACFQASTRLLWDDELITLAIARQGSLAAIWHALVLGADPNPPLTHWLVLLSTHVFGESAFGIRLPSILCVLAAILSLWNILRRWLNPGYAAVGILAFMATRGFDYAYEARSYAALMGFALAALALWLYSPEARGWRYFIALTGMAVALTLGLSSNYYGVLAFFPLAAGEVARTIRTRRPHFAVWVAMAVAALPLLVYLPLIHHNIAEFTPHAWNRPRASMISDTYLILVEGMLWPVVALAVYALWERRRLPSKAKALLPGESPIPELYEIAAIVTLLLYPILGFAVAALGAGMISPRCVVPVCCGFGIAAALLARRVFGPRPRAGVLTLAIVLLWVAARESACYLVLARQRTAFFILRDQIENLPADQPIVVADSLFILPLAHYSTPAVRGRIVFPIDFDGIHRYEQDDSGEQNLWAGRSGIFPIRIVPYEGALLGAPHINVIARPGGWLAQELQSGGVTLTPVDTPSTRAAWLSLGGVFTPFAHEGTQLLRTRTDR